MCSKNKLREKKLIERISLSQEEVTELSKIIVEKVKPLIGDKKLGIFMPIRNEVDLTELLEEGVGLPKITEGMFFYKYTGKFERGVYDILEPTGNIIDVEVILVPGLCYDLKGYRIGYGKGYYDQYLTDQHLKIGVCFDFQVVDEVYSESHDVRLDYVVTDKRILRW